MVTAMEVAPKADAKAEKPKAVPRIRSPLFPFITLGKAIDRAKEFYAKERRNAAPVGVAASHWGYGPKSSGGIQTVSAMKQYGLMEETGDEKVRTVKLTEMALRIILDVRPESQERNEAIKTAALKPKMHSEIWTKWRNELPSDDTFRTYLILDRKFNEVGANSLMAVYKDAIALAKLGGSDRLPEGAQDKDDNKQLPPGGRMQTEQKEHRGWTKSFTWPLSDGTTATLTVSGTRPGTEEIELLSDCMELAKKALSKMASQPEPEAEIN
jgi:hypothetical protein